MEIEKHAEEFKKIISKYSLSDKADELAELLASGKKISIEELSDKFGLSKEEALVFLSFIEIGIRFKEKHIDGKN